MSDLQRGELVPAVPGAWDRSLLKQLAEINAQLLELLVRAAAGRAVGCALVSELRTEWLEQTPLRLARLADCPYLLIDAAFASPACWLGVAGNGVRDVSALRRTRSNTTVLTPELLRPALVLAWHLARSNLLLARVALGINERCAALIGASRLQDLEALAELSPPWIRVRWEDQPQIWRQLLHATASEGSGQLRQLQLRGLQLLAAGCSI